MLQLLKKIYFLQHSLLGFDSPFTSLASVATHMELAPYEPALLIASVLMTLMAHVNPPSFPLHTEPLP